MGATTTSGGAEPGQQAGDGAAEQAPAQTGILPAEHWLQQEVCLCRTSVAESPPPWSLLRAHPASFSCRAEAPTDRRRPYFLHLLTLISLAKDPAADNDSAYGDDAASSTASLSTSILRYRTIHGRTFHSDKGNADYWTPNDERQNESMDIK